MKKKLLIPAIVLLFACAKQEAATTDVAAPQEAARGVAVQNFIVEPNAPAPAPPGVPRMIVKKAEMQITVADTAKAIDAVTKAIELQGGYVSGSHIWRDGELLRANLTLRVPSEKLTAALAQIRGVAKRVENETISSEDVSAEYVDLESRVRNLEATEEELRQLLVTARQNARKAADVLEVHQQLTKIRGEIEQARGRMRYLSQTTALSSIQLEILPDALAAPVVEPGWQPVVVAKNAVRALIGVVQSLANAAIWIVIYLLPIAGIFALAAYLLWKAVRRLRRSAAI